MKKLAIVYLTTIFITILFYALKNNDYHKVVRIVSATSFYVDKNDNMTADINELVVLEDLEYKENNLSKTDALKLQYLGKKYAEKTLLNKQIKIKNNNGIKNIIYENGESYRNNIIQNGYIPDGNNNEQVKLNINKAKSINLVALNKTTKKYHKLECPYVVDSSIFEIIDIKDLEKIAEPCKLCIRQDREETQTKYPKDIDEVYTTIYKDAFLEFYITDFTKQFYPSTKCLTTACKSLLKEINNAQNTIDFAIYGIDKQPIITNALINAQNRGVKVRWVYDTNKDGSTIYKDSVKLTKTLHNNRSDVQYNTEINTPQKDAIMHNKFFIFDSKKIWTGSANISHTDLSGFNANSVVLINSEEIAKIYKSEFEQMFNGKFHTTKHSTVKNKTTLNNSKISVYFSPQDNIIEEYIIPLIENSQKYIYIPVFVVTHKTINSALLKAANRGIDVKLIVDATSATSRYSSVKYLRNSGIKIKVENRAGKMHMKSIIIDDKYTIIGSMNFTKSGEKYNDENVLIIENTEMTKAFKNKFIHFWNDIPEKWLYQNPAAESKNSINSCYDGVDNDFDGEIDRNDTGCIY